MRVLCGRGEVRATGVQARQGKRKEKMRRRSRRRY